MPTTVPCPAVNMGFTEGLRELIVPAPLLHGHEDEMVSLGASCTCCLEGVAEGRPKEHYYRSSCVAEHTSF